MSSRAEARRAKRDLSGSRNPRVTAFTLCGLTAGIMGIIATSLLGSVSANVAGGQNVLYAVAAAVLLAAVTVDTVARRSRPTT